MRSIVHYLILLTYKCEFIFCQIEIDVEWEEHLIAKDKDYKCGIENKFKNIESARIINGKETTNIRYPWMVEVFRFIPKDYKKRNEMGSMCGGTIISDKSILTAAHCICIKYIEYKNMKTVTCLVDSDEPQNQNRQENQVHYSFGSKKPIKFPSPKFNKNIRAYIYKYEPKWWDEGTNDKQDLKKSKWKNGDVGMIIDDSESGISLKRYHGIPICLPLPKSFDEASHEVTLVGRGDIYQENVFGHDKRTSCITNGERVNNKKPGNENIKFKSCKNYDRNHPEGSCIRVQDATITKGGKPHSTGYDKNLISTDLSIKFMGEPGKPGRRMEIEIPQDDKCEELSNKVMEATDQLKHEGNFKFFKDDEKGPSRVVVFDNDHKHKNFKFDYFLWEKMGMCEKSCHHCYNLNRVENYGLCETESSQPSTTFGQPIETNYGFCGSSCRTREIRDLFFEKDPNWKKVNRRQWEMKATYYEDMKISEDFGEDP